MNDGKIGVRATSHGDRPHSLSPSPSPELIGCFLRRMVTLRSLFHNEAVLWQVDANKNVLKFLKIVAF